MTHKRSAPEPESSPGLGFDPVTRLDWYGNLLLTLVAIPYLAEERKKRLDSSRKKAEQSRAFSARKQKRKKSKKSKKRNRR